MSKDTGIINIHGKEYSTVAKRVSDFREEYKHDLSIVTELISADAKIVIMKAAIIDKNGFTIATGHAEEDRTKGQINKTSALENCETSAIGRALAAFGLAGTEFASANEVENAIYQQNQKPKPNPKPQQKGEWTLKLEELEEMEKKGIISKESVNSYRKPYSEKDVTECARIYNEIKGALDA